MPLLSQIANPLKRITDNAVNHIKTVSKNSSPSDDQKRNPTKQPVATETTTPKARAQRTSSHTGKAGGSSSGNDTPAKKSTAKKKPAKTPAVKKAAPKKASAAKKATPKKSAAKKQPADTPAAKKQPADTPTAKKKPADTPTAKKKPADTPAAKKPAAKKKPVKRNNTTTLDVDQDIRVKAATEKPSRVGVSDDGVDMTVAAVVEKKLEEDLAEDLQTLRISDDDESDDKEAVLKTPGATADPVKDYLRLIGRVKLLNAEQEVVLSKRVEVGMFAAHLLSESQCNCSPMHKKKMTADRRYDLERLVKQGEQAKDHLVNANLRLTVSLAKRYTGRGMLFLDLIQEGNLGLIRAVEKFDYKKGYKFSTYATWWIRQAITRAMADQSRTIRIPVHAVERINKVSRVRRELRSDLNREPTLEEIAAETEFTIEQVQELLEHNKDMLSLSMELGEDGTSELGDLIEDTNAIKPDDVATYTEMQRKITALLEGMADREATIVAMRTGLQDGERHSLEAVGNLFGITKERVRQIELRALTKLRHPSRSHKLGDFVDLL